MAPTSRIRAKLQLELLSGLVRRRSQASSQSSGFTLVELMVVTAVFCLIASVAIPTLLRARNRSEAGSVVGQLAGLAKECAVANAARLEEVISVNGVSVTCNGAAVTISGRPFRVPADGVVCLGVTAGPSVSGVYVTVEPNGNMQCSFT
jgi:prepilin-type N-terminal cleavage/methylation domain-containing protein